MRFKRVDPHPGETRRYVTDISYRDGTYIITRQPRGSWAAWVIENTSNPTADFVGWRAIRTGLRTMSDARVAAGMHLERNGTVAS